MPTLQIRNIPEDLYNELRILAKKSHRSLNQQTIFLLSKAIGYEELRKKTKKANAIAWIKENSQEISIDPKMAIKWIREDRDK